MEKQVRPCVDYVGITRIQENGLRKLRPYQFIK